MNFRRVLLTLALFCITPLAAQQSGPPTPPSTNTLAQRLGYPANARLLILHADDFGMMHTVDTATEEALEKHWVTSASILVPCPWFREVAQWAKVHPEADLGIHLALTSEWTSYRWPSVSGQPNGSSLLDTDGYLPLTVADVVAHVKMPDVETEVHAQVDKAKAAGIQLSHLDTHMGAFLSSPQLFDVYLGASRAYKLPVLLAQNIRLVREYAPQLPADKFDPNTIVLDKGLALNPGVAKTNSKADWLEAYEKLLQPLPPGTYQLIVHLAHNDAEIQGATFDHPDFGAEWRQNDFDLVRSPEFQKFLKDQGFILVSWGDLAKAPK